MVQCTWCGELLSSSVTNWKDQAATRKSSLAGAGPLRNEDTEFFLREFFCPKCATVLEVEVASDDMPPIYDRVEQPPGW